MTYEDRAEPAALVELTSVELYSEARISEFDQNAEMTEAELAQARARWNL